MSDSNSTDATILIVDDEQGLADLYGAWLTDKYTVRTAYDGQQALEVISDDVDVVLLDRRMPGLSGDDVLTEFRNRGFEQPVAMLTAVNPEFDVVEMEIDEYFVKPLDADDLRSAAKSLVTRAQYDESIRAYFATVSKKVALETTKSEQELAGSDEYAALEQAVEDAEYRADDALAEMTATDAFARFRDV